MEELYSKKERIVNFFIDYRIHIIFILMSIFSLILIIIPFMQHNNLYTWDGSGQVAALEFMDETCFPHFVCHNQYYFMGFTQGQFYPQGMYWISSLMHHFFFIPLHFSFKLLLMLSLLIFPISLYYFLRKIDIEEDLAIILTVSAFIIFFINRGYDGANVKSILDIGLYSHFFLMPFLFFYAATLKEYFDEKKTWFWPTALMVLIVLTHVVAALSAALIFVALFISKIVKDKGEKSYSLVKIFKKALFHVALVSGLTAFWVIPYIVKISYSTGIKLSANYFIDAPFLLLLAFFSLAYFLKYSKEQLSLPLMAVVILSFILVADTRFIKSPLHLYRLTVLISMILLMCIIIAVYRLNNPISNLIIAGIFIFLFFSLLTQLNNFHPKGIYDQELPSIPQLYNSRYYISVPSVAQSSPHYLQSMIPQRSKVISLKGLFIEGTYMSRYVMMLDKVSDSGNLMWSFFVPKEISSMYEEERFLNRTYYILGVSKVLKEDETYPEGKTKINYYIESDQPTFRQYNYSLEDVGDNRIIEALGYIPEKLTDRTIDQWFHTDLDSGFLSLDEIPFVRFNKDAVVSDVFIEHKEFSFNIDKYAPVLVRISYYPNWKAYDEKGKDIKIYRVTPGFMLVFAQGKVTFKYKYLNYEKLSIFLSFFTFVLLWFVLFKKHYRESKAYLYSRKQSNIPMTPTQELAQENEQSKKIYRRKNQKNKKF